MKVNDNDDGNFMRQINEGIKSVAILSFQMNTYHFFLGA